MRPPTADMLLLTPLERVTSPLAWLDEYRLTYSPSPPSSLALSLYMKTRGRTAQAQAGVRVKPMATRLKNSSNTLLLLGGVEIKGCMTSTWKPGKKMSVIVSLLHMLCRLPETHFIVAKPM